MNNEKKIAGLYIRVSTENFQKIYTLMEYLVMILLNLLKMIIFGIKKMIKIKMILR